jgi:hypothetical protein
MKLNERDAKNIAEICANKIIAEFGEKKLALLPYDVLGAEISGMIEDIEDRVDKIIASKIEESSVTHTIDDLWE